MASKKQIRKEKQRLKKECWARDNYICQKCGFNMIDDFRMRNLGRVKRYLLNLTVDHVIPKSKGGLWTLENLATLCKDCNEKKADRI